MYLLIQRWKLYFFVFFVCVQKCSEELLLCNAHGTHNVEKNNCFVKTGPHCYFYNFIHFHVLNVITKLGSKWNWFIWARQYIYIYIYICGVYRNVMCGSREDDARSGLVKGRVDAAETASRSSASSVKSRRAEVYI